MKPRPVGMQFAADAVQRQYAQRLPESVEIIDCTLRDGEQAAGVWFTSDEKIKLARLLDAAGVSVLDAGFPAASGEEVEVLQALRQCRLDARIAATARATISDIAACKRAQAEEVFMFLATSDIRLRTLGLDRQGVARQLRVGAEEIAGLGMGVNIVAEDAYRTDPTWLVELLNGLHDIPIARFILADTVGAAFPQSIEHAVSVLRDHINPEIAIAMHCHNDFGMAVANTLSGVLGGARSITCTVNGIGERAGNADLSECVAALTHIFGIQHRINPACLAVVSDAVERASGIHMSALKPVTGYNVYSHESGVHVHGLLNDPRTYEFLPAAWTGRRSRIVLGKHSGVSSVAHIMRERGLPELDDAQQRELLDQVKGLSRARPKNAHVAAHIATVEQRQQLLAGVDEESVVSTRATTHLSMTVPKLGDFDRAAGER